MSKYYTDYPITELCDDPFKLAPIREVELISYDGDKYALVKVVNIETEIKTGYIYTERGRCGIAPCIDPKKVFDKDYKVAQQDATHKDFLGNPISIGDTVAVTPKNYRGLVKAKVVSFANTQLNLEYMGNSRTFMSTYRTPPNYVIVIK